MGTQRLYQCFLTGVFVFSLSLMGTANDNKPYRAAVVSNTTMVSVADSIPPPENKKAGEPAGTKTQEIIKEVPKSRKQVKPLAITPTVTVKPVIVKPKIVVKPIIKLH